MPAPAKTWQSCLDYIPLRRNLNLTLKQDNNGIDVFCKDLPGMVGSGKDLAHALEMFFDHLIIDYYEHNLNPGEQTSEEHAYGLRLKRYFNSEREASRLLKPGCLE